MLGAMTESSRKRVTVFQNGKKSGGKVVNIPKKWSEFLKMISKKLVLPVSRIFNEDGGEIDEIEAIIPKEILYASCGEAFIHPNENKFSNDITLSNEWVTLNVGGRLFSTTRSTLLKDRESMLAKMFSDNWDSTRDSNGCYLIDRSPDYFSPIINYLRCGTIVIDDGINVEGVYQEARFFNITGMIEKLATLVERKNRSDVFTRKDVISILLTSSSNSSLRCQGLNLSGVDLSKLDLRNINFKMTNFRETNLSKCNLDNALLQEADLSGADLSGASLRGTNLTGANLENCILKGANFEDRGGQKAILENCNFKNAVLEESNFSGANLRVSNFKGANLENCNLRGADLAGTNFEESNLRGANLHKANLIGVNLRGANFDIRTNQFPQEFNQLREANNQLRQEQSIESTDHLPGYKCQHDDLLDEQHHQHVKSYVELNLLSNQLKQQQQLEIDNLQQNVAQEQEVQAEGFIRLNFSYSLIQNNADPYACYSEGQDIQIGGSKGQPFTQYTCTKKDILDQQLSNLIIQYVVAAIRDVFQSMIKVNQVNPLKLDKTVYDALDGNCYYGVPIPESYVSVGIPNTDYVVFVTIRPTKSSGTIAYATACNYGATIVNGKYRYSRPLAGVINFNPSYFTQFVGNTNGFIFNEYVRVGIHEMIHAFGFSGSFYSHYSNGTSTYEASALLTKTGKSPSGQDFTYQKNAITSPLVAAFSSNHYSCKELNYQELEDYGGSGTAGSHWEKRTVGEEIMLGFINPILPITNLTLSLLQDTGWYNVDFSKAEPLMWGKKLGCDWYEDCTPTSWDLQGYWCQDKQTACSPTRSGKGYCQLQSATIPVQFQHYPVANTGGVDAIADYCPFYDMIFSNSVFCLDSAQTADTTIKESYGSNSRCFEYTSSGTTTVKMACWQQRCSSNGTLEIQANGIWNSCPSGQTVTFGSVNVICPKNYYPCEVVGVPPITPAPTSQAENSTTTALPTYNLTVLIDKKGLQILSLAKEQVTIVKHFSDYDNDSKVVWIAFKPFQNNSVTWEEEYGVYASSTTIVNGATIERLSTRDSVLPDNEYPFLPAGYFGDQDGNNVNGYGIVNQYSETLTFGLCQKGLVNGEEVISELNAVSVPANEQVVFTPSVSLSIFAAAHIDSGSVISYISSKSCQLNFGHGEFEKIVKYDSHNNVFIEV
eukprot:gene4089-5117_t